VGDTDYDSNKDQNIYTGSELKPTITVKDGERTLTAGNDYTITWTYKKVDGTPDTSFDATANGAFTNAGTYTATIAGKVNYDEQFTRDYVIKQKDVTLEMIALTNNGQGDPVDNITIQDNEQLTFIPVVTVKDGETDITSLVDIVWSTFDINQMAYTTIATPTQLTTNSAGYYNIKVTPKAEANNYSSFATKMINILQSIDDSSLLSADGVTFTRKPASGQDEQLTGNTMTYNGIAYDLTTAVKTGNNTSVGAEHYNVLWTNEAGQEIKKITHPGGTETITWKDNDEQPFKDAGTYTITIAALSGEGHNFTGVRSRTFKIDPATLDRSWFVLMNGEYAQTDVYYDNMEHKPDVKVTTDTNVNVPTGLSVEN